MADLLSERPTWEEVLKRHQPLQLPVAHDALTAVLIERAGFPAYQIGGFALDGTRFAYPDIDLTHFGEKHAAAQEIIAACSLPVLVDGDDGYGDAKNVTRTVQGYEAIGASALFIEDQRAPKRCGHMAKKEVVPVEVMERKVRAAVAARRNPDTFILARTDALAPEGLDDALRRAERYRRAGADGVYVEGPQNLAELERIGKEFGSFPLATSILENGGKTPWVSPEDLHAMGYAMILYPTTVLFRLTYATERALEDLKAGRPLDRDQAVDMKGFEEIVGISRWQKIEREFGGPGESGQ
jgi:2-methylisocitrate lyase-like PEP mutase family enzyme